MRKREWKRKARELNKDLEFCTLENQRLEEKCGDYYAANIRAKAEINKLSARLGFLREAREGLVSAKLKAEEERDKAVASLTSWLQVAKPDLVNFKQEKALLETLAAEYGGVPVNYKIYEMGPQAHQPSEFEKQQTEMAQQVEFAEDKDALLYYCKTQKVWLPSSWTRAACNRLEFMNNELSKKNRELAQQLHAECEIANKKTKQLDEFRNRIFLYEAEIPNLRSEIVQKLKHIEELTRFSSEQARRIEDLTAGNQSLSQQILQNAKERVELRRDNTSLARRLEDLQNRCDGANLRFVQNPRPKALTTDVQLLPVQNPGKPNYDTSKQRRDVQCNTCGNYFLVDKMQFDEQGKCAICQSKGEEDASQS